MNFSAYTPMMFLFPFTAPLVRVLAKAFPDRSLRKMKHSREVIVGSVADLIKQHRRVLAEEVTLTQSPLCLSLCNWSDCLALFGRAACLPVDDCRGEGN